MHITSLGLFGNPTKPDLSGAVARIRRLGAEKGVEVHLTAALAAALGGDAPGLEEAELVARSSVVIALGGDGTMLRAARLIGTSGVPLLGINLGSLGYLTDVRIEELEDALDRLLTGEVRVDWRARVYCEVSRDGVVKDGAAALNDLVVNMGPLPRALDLELLLDDASLGRFLGDGMIFSTPTGSTAYNLSAGGPICQADLCCLLITPICPHSLGMRPLIVTKDMKIELLLKDVGEGASLTADGQSAISLSSGDSLRVWISDPEVALIKDPSSNPYRVMRHKLGWGAPERHRGSSD